MARIKGGRSSHGAGREAETSAFVQELVEWKRISKVSKGGKRMRFSAGVVVGDRKGSIGYVLRKGREVSNAVSAAAERALRSPIRIALREGRTLHHDVTCFLGGGRVHLRSAPPGTGIIAGGAMRHVFSVLGIQDIVSKSLGSSNKNNTVRATLKALQNVESVRSVAARRGLKVSQVLPHKQVEEGAKDNASS